MLDSAQIQDQLRLAAMASAFDLTRPAEFDRSVRQLVQLFYDLQTAYTPTYFLEVGAHEAQFSREMAGLHPGAKVVAFEGNPDNYAHFTAQFDYAAARVDYRHSLVSDQDGVAELKMQKRVDGRDAPAIRGNDSMLTRTQPGVEYEQRQIPSTRLDTAFGEAVRDGATFAMWVDVEGATQQVFAGGPGTLARTTSILIEVEEHSFWEGQWLVDDVQTHLAQFGFFPLARDFQHPYQYNIVFVQRALWSNIFARSAFANFLSRIAHP